MREQPVEHGVKFHLAVAIGTVIAHRRLREVLRNCSAIPPYRWGHSTVNVGSAPGTLKPPLRSRPDFADLLGECADALVVLRCDRPMRSPAESRWPAFLFLAFRFDFRPFVPFPFESPRFGPCWIRFAMGMGMCMKQIESRPQNEKNPEDRSGFFPLV